MRPQLSPEASAAVYAYMEDQIPMTRFWRRFTPDQRDLADALDLELVRLAKKVGADDYFGALGIAPSSDFDRIQAAADRICAQFSEACVRDYGLNRKAGGWVFKARQIDALARHVLDTLGQMKQEGKLAAYADACRSALTMAMARPATAPTSIKHHQGERPSS